ncbi:nucleoside diphosphate kinase [Streptomyces griseochromogenes]|uniref:Nucleoside diphosphate kinase n=1 Tax=Streptomyces griseochromogenes TaxID=68214 RepID=A0ABS4M496_9ACTN|nr:nucleoside-diphosphate kinase [Streptomyces griseochromogenes]MBP2054494.1 nucleoside diphosphate kinase [Streptomyces griseochromogenes]
MPDSDFWSRHVFVLLSSDAPYRGVHADMVKRLRKEGFPPVAARALHADPELIDDLYADLIAGQWQTWRYRLVDAVLALGPAMALICRYEGDTGQQPERGAHDILALRKGYQHPEQAEHGTLRRDFGAVNSIVGLMHSSDGPAESEREAAIFGLTAADAAADPEAAAAEIDYLCQVVAPHTPEHRDFDQVLAAVRTRVLASLWEDLPADVRRRVRERFPEPAGLGEVSAGAELAALLAGHAPEPLPAFIACEFEPSAAGSMRMSVAEQALRTTGVVLDPWERVVLESSLHFQPLRASRQAVR